MPDNETAGQELFRLIEQEQGYAFLSDAVEELPNARVFDLARGSLRWTEKSARTLRAFLKRHNQST